MNNEKLELINVFEKPYQFYKYKSKIMKKNEVLVNEKVKDKLLKTIKTHKEATIHILKESIDEEMENYISTYLENSEQLKNWRKTFPTKTPQSLSKYQQNYKNHNPEKVNEDINKDGNFLSDGQILFHGGTLNINNILSPNCTKKC